MQLDLLVGQWSVTSAWSIKSFNSNLLFLTELGLLLGQSHRQSHM